MEDLLEDANNKLQMAIVDLEENNYGSGRRLAVAVDAGADTSMKMGDDDNASSPLHEQTYDLDDDSAAAAFFERQARKKDAEKMLRINEWAQTITFYQCNDKGNDGNPVEKEGTGQQVHHRTLADVLYKEFKAGFTT